LFEGGIPFNIFCSSSTSSTHTGGGARPHKFWETPISASDLLSTHYRDSSQHLLLIPFVTRSHNWCVSWWLGGERPAGCTRL